MYSSKNAHTFTLDKATYFAITKIWNLSISSVNMFYCFDFRYANVGPAAAQALREELLREGRLSYVHNGDSPIPPYMPLQQPVSRKSTSLEKRIKKKKEKEGCKQQ